MTLTKNINTLEAAKFAETNDGKVAVRVMPLGVFVPSEFDAIQAEYPSPTTEVFTYSFQGNQVASITVTYLDSSKDQILSVVRA